MPADITRLMALRLAVSEHVYRGVKPMFQNQPYSGEGARLFGGRFNPIGASALYLGMEPDNVIKELTKGVFENLTPTTLYRMSLESTALIDLTNPDHLEALDVTHDDLARDWRMTPYKEFDIFSRRRGGLGLLPISQRIYFALRAAEVDAIKVPSFAKSASPAAVNIVLFEWNNKPQTQISLFDPAAELTVTGDKASPVLPSDLIADYNTI